VPLETHSFFLHTVGEPFTCWMFLWLNWSWKSVSHILYREYGVSELPTAMHNNLFYGSHMGVFMWHSQVAWDITSWRSHAKISKLWCWLVLDKVFFGQFWLLHSWIAVLFEAHEAMFAFSSWLRSVMEIHLLYSSIASTGILHVKIQLLLFGEGPQPDAAVCMLRMFLRMLNNVTCLIPGTAVSWHLT